MHEEKIKFSNCIGKINFDFKKRGILFLSGFFADKDESHNLFKDYAKILHEEKFSTLRIDLSGLGESKIDWKNISMKRWADDTYKALEIFNFYGIENIGIIGFSLGSSFAILNYSKNEKLKKKIKALALWAPAINPHEDMLKRYKRQGKIIRAGKIVPDKILNGLKFDVLEELENVDCPILICHSKKDPYIPIQTSKDAKRKIKNLYKFVELKNSGHSFRPQDNSQNNIPRKIVYENTLKFFRKYLR